MSGTVLLGYDVETASDSTGGFLEGAAILHDKHDVPWAIYVTGTTVEKCTDAIRSVRDNELLTICQHTYDHMLLKNVYMMPGDGKPVHGQSPNAFIRGGTLEQIREQIGKTQALLRDLIGVECHGLTGPWCYYRGLVDRPDVLQALEDNGIRWVRAYGRDSRDCQPTPFTAQPFFYNDQGFPDILELGMQGYQDDFYWDRFDDRRYGDTYQHYLYAMLGEVAKNDWVWSVASHDHGTPTKKAFFESKGKWIEDFITRGKEVGVRFASPGNFYDQMVARRDSGEQIVPSL
jgi:peptidoglycan/xylan/chitin deacetylase (PgdA/CDA1 family)